MGLGKYRPYKDEFHDEGYEKRVTVPADFVPDFYNRNTIQVWDVSSVASVECVNGKELLRRQKLA
jgi:Zn ribbon nucleic-acid-binding protein